MGSGWIPQLCLGEVSLECPASVLHSAAAYQRVPCEGLPALEEVATVCKPPQLRRAAQRGPSGMEPGEQRRRPRPPWERTRPPCLCQTLPGAPVLCGDQGHTSSGLGAPTPHVSKVDTREPRILNPETLNSGQSTACHPACGCLGLSSENCEQGASGSPKAWHRTGWEARDRRKMKPSAWETGARLLPTAPTLT